MPELSYRWLISTLVLIIAMLLENSIPHRVAVLARLPRWRVNFSLAIINALWIALLPVTVVWVTMVTELRGWGFFSLVYLPAWLEFLLAFLILDFSVYAIHRLYHSSSLLWRLHAPHHADEGIDASSAYRFHPLEMLLSLALRSLLVMAFGLPVVAVVVYEVVLNGMALFTHANIRLPAKLDKVAQHWIVTPSMHVFHHSCLPEQMSSNYGTCLVCWDKLCGTWLDSSAGYPLRQGLEKIGPQEQLSLARMLALPFYPCR